MRRLLVLGLIVLAGSMFLATGRASAGVETLTVTTTADTFDGTCDADCSIRDAVSVANDNINRTRIDLFAGTFFIQAAPPDYGAFVIDTDVEIFGASDDTTLTVVDGGMFDTVFKVTLEGDLTLSGLTVTHGKGGDAGGIRALGLLTTRNVTVMTNEGTNGPGGISALQLHMFDSQVTDNTGEGAGGIYMLFGDITRSSISANTAVGTAQAGGLYVIGETTLTDVTVSSNTANGVTATGGIVALGQRILQDRTLAPAGGVIGGDGITRMERVVVSDNTVTVPLPLGISGGGGGGAGGISASGNLEATDIDISGNVAAASGAGGLHFESPEGHLTLNRAAVTVNQAESGVGGIQLGGSATITNTTISGNETQGGVGALAAFTDLSIVASTIAFNTAVGDIGAAIATDEEATITGSIVADNEPMNCLSLGGLGGEVPTSLGYNIDSRESCGFDGPGDMENTDPQIQSLHDYGGDAGPTHRLQDTSPAINAWTVGCPPPGVDQRRAGRPSDGTCDIGAYEADDDATRTIAWGDNTCGNGLDAVDAAFVLAFLAGIDPETLPQGGPCPNIGLEVSVVGYQDANYWADVDCSDIVTVLDALYVLQEVAQDVAGPAGQPQFQCPDVGQEVELD